MKNAIGFTRTISFKLMLVGFLSLMLLIPAALIRTIIILPGTQPESE